MGKVGEIPLDENPFADWSCHLFTAARTQYIIVSNTPSLYSCVMYGRGNTDYSQLITRALVSIREFMEDDGLGHVYHQMVAPSSATVSCTEGSIGTKRHRQTGRTFRRAAQWQ